VRELEPDQDTLDMKRIARLAGARDAGLDVVAPEVTAHVVAGNTPASVGTEGVGEPVGDPDRRQPLRVVLEGEERRLARSLAERDVGRSGGVWRHIKAHRGVFDGAPGELLSAVVETGLGTRCDSAAREADRYDNRDEAHQRARGSWAGKELL
jgi:hypothetical protein